MRGCVGAGMVTVSNYSQSYTLLNIVILYTTHVL